MEKNTEYSNVIKANDTKFETVYIITEEELVNSFDVENCDREIIVDGSFFSPEQNSFVLDEQNVHLQTKENILDDINLMPVISEKDINNTTVNNCENIPDQPEDNFNSIKVATRENESSFVENSQPALIDYDLDSVDKSILMDHVLSSVIDSQQNSVLDPDEDLSMVHDQRKTSDCHQTIENKSSISFISEHASYVKLQSFDWDEFPCPYCEKKFGKKRLMKKHMMRMHKFPASKSPYVCSYCAASFQQKNLLRTHYEIQHKMFMTALDMAKSIRDSVPFPPDIEKDKRDTLPSEITPDIENDKRDILPSQIPPDIDRTNPAPSTKKNSKRKNKINSYNKKKERIKCIECNFKFAHFRSFREHLLTCHYLDVTEKEIRFPNMTAFKKWKLDIERRDLTFFTCQSGAKKLVNCIYRRYCCHRSGYRYSPGANKNRMKNVIGSSKTGFFCTASMSVSEYPHEVHVKYCLQHYGHGGGITFGHLSNEQQAAIQENVLNGIPLEEQLNNIKDTQSSAEHFQALIMKKRDISFIDKADASEVYNAGMNAVEYVEQWVRTCSEMEDSPILLYRHEEAGTKSEDLMLIIMTEFQKHILMTSAKQVVCLAYPNRIKRGHNLLTALIVIDDQEVAFPVAFCISNKVNKSSMSEFLSSVKESTGPLSFSYFMSNDDKFFYEAWQEVMQDESKWVWSIWSFDDRIRKLLWQPKTAVKDINTREATYRLFRTIIECNSQPVFATMFKNYKNSLLDNAMTRDFGKHFVSQYDSNPEMWACCYRKDIKLSTNIFIEYLYKTMQYCGKVTRTRQLDKFLMVVMKWLRCKMLDRLSNMLDEDKISLAKNTITMCHNIGLEIECENVVSLSDKIWLIRSQNEVDAYVTQEYESCPDLCDLRCPDCDVCVHMYSCSCVQSLIHANMCQHIHAVVWKFLTPHFSPPASPVPDPCDDVDDISADHQIIADKEPDLLKSVLKRMQGVYKQVRINKCKLNKASLLEVLRLLNRCYQICSCDEEPPHLLSESTQTEYNLLSKSKAEDNPVSKSKIEAVPVGSLNRVLKDLNNTLSISYPSSIPVMAFDSVLHPVGNSSNPPLNSSSISVPPPKLTLKSLNKTVSGFSERRENIDAFLCKSVSNAALNNITLGSSSERHETDSLCAANSIFSTSSKRCKKFKLVPTAPLKTPLGCFSSNVPNSAVQNRKEVNFIPVVSPNDGSDKVGRISLLPSNPVPSSSSNSVSNSRPVAKKRLIERSSVLGVPLMIDSSNIFDSSVMNSPVITKTTVSSSNILPAVSANTISNSFSPASSVIEPSGAWVSALKNNSELKTNSTNRVVSIIVPDASVDNVTNSVLKTPGVNSTVVSALTSKNHSEVKTNSTDLVLFNILPDASVNNVPSYVLQTPIGKPTSVFTSKNHSEAKANSTDQVLFIAVPDASVNPVTNSVLQTSVCKPTAVSDSTSKNHSEVKADSTDQVLFIAVPDASVNPVTNSVLQTSVCKPTAVSDSTSKNHSEVKADSTDQVLFIAVPDASVNPVTNSVLQTSVCKPTAVSDSTSKNNSEVKANSTDQVLFIAVSDASVDPVTNSVLQTPAVKPTAVSDSTSKNYSEVKANSTDQVLFIAVPDASVDPVTNSVLQTPAVKPTAVSDSTSKNYSEVKANSTDQVLFIAVPDASVNPVTNSVLQTSVGKPTAVSDSTKNHSEVKANSTSQLSYVALPDVFVNTASNSILQVPSVTKPTKLPVFVWNNNFNASTNSASKILYLAVPDASANSLSNSVSQSSLAMKPTSASVSTSNNNSNVTSSADHLLYVALPHIPLNTILNLASQAPSDVKSTTGPVSITNNFSDVTAHFSSHLLHMPLPVASTNAGSSFISHKPVISSINSSNKSDKIRRIPILSSNSVPNSFSKYNPVAKRCLRERKKISGEPLLKDSSDPVTSSPLIVKTTDSSSTNLPTVSDNNSVSQVSSVIKPSAMSASAHIERASVPDLPLAKDTSNISNNTVPNSPSRSKPAATTDSSSTNLPTVSVNNSVSQVSSVSKSSAMSASTHIERTSVPDLLLIEDSSNISESTVANPPLIVKTTISSSDHLLVSVNTVSNSISHSKPAAKKRHIERTSVSDVPLTKDSSNFSSDPVTSSPLIVKTTDSSSTKLPAVSVNNSVSQVFSVIKPFGMSASTSDNDSAVITPFIDKVSCFEKIPDEMTNASDFQLATSSSVKSCPGKSDASRDTSANYILKPSSDLITSSDAVNSSQPPVSTPNKQPGCLQFVWEPVAKKRYVVKARVPFTPRSCQSSISSATEVNSAS